MLWRFNSIAQFLDKTHFCCFLKGLYFHFFRNHATEEEAEEEEEEKEEE